MGFELPEEDRAMVLCFRTSDLLVVTAASTVKVCERCQAAVWFHDATHRRVNEEFTDDQMDLLCTQCAVRQMQRHPGRYRLTLTPEQEVDPQLAPMVAVLREMQRRDKRTGRL